MNGLSVVIVALLFASLPVVHGVELKLSYDANGNLVTGDGKYRVYNGLNQLSKVYNGSNATGLLLEEYTYHPTQERILFKKVYNNDTTLKETTYYLTTTFMQVVNASGTYNITEVYHDGQLVAQNTNGAKVFIHGDQKGSTTVVTSDATTGNTSGSLPQMIFQDSFCSSDRGYSGYDARDSSQCSLNKTNSYGNIYSPNEAFETNYADSVADFNLTVVFRYPGGTNNKFYPTVTCASLGSTSNRFNFEQGNSTHFHIKADRGGWSSTNDVPYNTTITALFETNATTNRSRACIGTSCTNWETYTRDAGAEDCFATSFTSISGGAFQIYNVTGWQNLKAYNTTGTNVTILETNTYSPFGERLNNSNMRLGYEGKEADTVVGDTDFAARRYRPDYGIFTQPDKVLQDVYTPQDLNAYTFERNNPLKYTDQNGQDAIVVNNPTQAGGFGHIYLIVGNDHTGYTRIEVLGKDGSLPGDPHLEISPRTNTFSLRKDDRSITYPTSEAQDKAMLSAAREYKASPLPYVAGVFDCDTTTASIAGRGGVPYTAVFVVPNWNFKLAQVQQFTRAASVKIVKTLGGSTRSPLGYSASAGGYVTSDGRVYPTSNSQWVPASQTQGGSAKQSSSKK